MPKEKIVTALKKQAVPMDSIAPDPADARMHPEANLDAIRGSLMAFGQQRPVVVDAKGVIVAGNGLYAAARQLGWEKIAAVKTTLRGADRMAYALADNRTAELAEWDEEALLRQLEELAGQVDTAALGFDQEDLARLLHGDGGGPTWEEALGRVPEGERYPFQKMTFTVTDRQAAAVRDAIKAAKAAGRFGKTGNDNSNGNALARIAKAYLDG